MTVVRQPAVAGSFYPADRTVLRQALRRYLHTPQRLEAPPHALIVPHAGYDYSGPIAGTAYALLEPHRTRISRVVLIGPSHRVYFDGLATSSATSFSTPLGEVPLDRAVIERLLELPAVTVLDDAHTQEHSLEVHLPFLQETLSSFSLVPLVAGNAEPSDVERVIEALWGEPQTLFVISSDLSHYHSYETAQQLDRRTSDSIEALKPEEIEYEQACGRVPIAGLLRCARRHGVAARTVDLRNSGDTAGPRDQVVGYGAYVVT